MTTLTEYLQPFQSKNTQHIQPTTEVIETIANVGKDIAQLLRKGALADILGEVGQENVQGEQQKKLDVIANDLLLDALAANAHCAGVASEELDHATAAHPEGSLLVLFDPLDGSSNIDINMPTGTIFSILPHNKPGQAAQDSDFLQKGTEQLASGYLLYASSVILTFTLAPQLAQQVGIDDGVVMFSLDPDSGEFLLINKNIGIDEDTQEYAINASNYRHWLPPMQQYVDELLAGKTGPRGKNFNTRWVAAMVGDVHRILCRGGIFIYPKDTKDPSKAGKLRLMYEANPMSLLIERAGGASTDAINRIMDYEPTDIHQRVAVVLGAKNEVEHVQTLHAQ
ncbi:class 1 fructose-bisphosphatase [Psychrobacter sp. FDAARGOS_221]|uniref:class 1 fructose-bisphosphatase n=1 Tax=Psychrobacter sp. FDAARGOS_221 TaxID=1975705 RepID=UPI000BB570A5|nr:class 1 fructose-bisphosphatase [Psychrobacter sp. FDAARGOS_221]PNK61303.1 class 1 fructose-bisphosphatase [Psychrobacter sp. FDAARGOS_221]